MTDTSVCQALFAELARAGRPYARIDHAEARTAEEAALARGTPLAIGGKSALMKIERLGNVIVVVGSDRRLDGKRLRKALGVQRYRFATAEELSALGGLVSGAVPAFGRPCVDAELVVGDDVSLREEIAFAAGSTHVSVRMRVADWLAVARPRVVPCFTEPVSPGGAVIPTDENPDRRIAVVHGAAGKARPRRGVETPDEASTKPGAPGAGEERAGSKSGGIRP